MGLSMVVGGSLLAIFPLQISIEKLQSKNKKIDIWIDSEVICRNDVV
jgi:hypothetical protein